MEQPANGNVNQLYSKKIVRSKKTGECEGETAFLKNGVIFHPIPHDLRKKVKEGEVWMGTMKSTRDSGRTDKRGIKIYQRYFIPERRVEDDNHQD